MSIRFGDHSNDAGGVQLDDGMYDATIASANLVTDATGKPKVNDNGKKQVDIVFAVDESTTPKRRFSIGFGQNNANKQWAAFAKLVETATGIKCGDPAQREVTDAQLVGKQVRIVIENVNGYSNIVNVLPGPKPNGAAAKPKPQPVAAGNVAGDDSDEIPY